jgi:hypothetical protein
MSQYRDDRAAARLRIEALEARLAEREVELRRHGAALAARDDEIFRLQRELERSGGIGPRRMRSVDAAWASRIVGATTGLALLAAGAGATMVHAPATGGAVPIVVVTDAPDPVLALMAPGRDAPESTIHADPLVNGASDWTEPSQVAAPTAPRAAITVERQVEPRVWGGRSREDDARLLRSMMSLCQDDACRERARALVERSHVERP